MCVIFFNAHFLYIHFYEFIFIQIYGSTINLYKNIEKYGNMSSACIPVAFCCAVEEGRLKRGDKTVLVSMGGGLTWGAVLLKY